MPQLFGFPQVEVRGPRVLPWLGVRRQLFRLLDDPVGTVMGLRPHGDVVALIDRNPAVVCVFGPERNREVLSNPALFAHDEGLFDGPEGSALDKLRHVLVVMNGERHRRQRGLMAPAFAKSAIDGYCADIVAITTRALARWPRSGVVDASALCHELMLAVALKCFYGLDEGAAGNGIGRTVGEFMKVVTAPATIMFPLDLPGSPYRRKLRLAEQFVAEVRRLIARKRELGAPMTDAMGLLMAARDGDGGTLSDDELVGEALELVVAGHDTSAMALTWTLFLLDQHPDVLRELKAELSGVLGGRPPAPDELTQLPLLDRVVKESMRLLSPAPTLFLRACSEDTKLGGHWLPKHANVLVSPLATHHDAALYPEPRRFRPERWLGAAPATYAYLPFGAGARTCVGMLFAAKAIRLALAMILQHSLLRCEAGAEVARLTRGNIMHTRRGLPMRIGAPGAPIEAARAVRGDVHELVELTLSR